MSHIDRLSEKYDLKHWPHKFTKKGPVRQIGERDVGDSYKEPIFAQPMVCVACGIEFVSGMDNRPPDPCPARTQKSEMKRLLS